MNETRRLLASIPSAAPALATAPAGVSRPKMRVKDVLVHTHGKREHECEACVIIAQRAAETGLRFTRRGKQQPRSSSRRRAWPRSVVVGGPAGGRRYGGYDDAGGAGRQVRAASVGRGAGGAGGGASDGGAGMFGDGRDREQGICEGGASWGEGDVLLPAKLLRRLVELVPGAPIRHMHDARAYAYAEQPVGADGRSRAYTPPPAQLSSGSERGGGGVDAVARFQAQNRQLAAGVTNLLEEMARTRGV